MKKTNIEKINFLQNNLKTFVDMFQGVYESLREDQDTGFEEGLYDVETTPELEAMKVLIDGIEGIELPDIFNPKVYVYVEGGLIQGASGNCNMSFNVFDQDNYDAGNLQEEFIETFGTPKEWDAMIEEKTEKGEITGIF